MLLLLQDKEKYVKKIIKIINDNYVIILKKNLNLR